MEPTKSTESSPSLKDLSFYFLKLGAVGFGGPVVLCERMHRDLVEERRWITEDEYSEGFALSQLAPGPLAAQLAIYLGWVLGGNLWATVIAVCFVIPSLIIVLILSAVYILYGGLSWMQGAFYGVGAAVIAIIGTSAFKLVTKTFKKDKVLWTLGVVSALFTAWTETENLWLFLLGGIVMIFYRRPPKFSNVSLAVFFPAVLFTGLKGVQPEGTLWNLFLYFVKAGAFVFGSGLAIVPFLHGGVVGEHQWLTDRQFLDAVAVAMITPGPVVITVAFIGYLVCGPIGAVVAALGVFLPCYLFVIIPAPYFKKFSKNLTIKSFVDGITAAAIGAIGGAVFVLGKRAIIDSPTVIIALAAFVILLKTKKVPESVLLLLAGVIGWWIR